MAKAKKEFNTKLYAVVVFVVVASLLATITTLTYKSKYTAFSPEKTAIAFTKSIVETGDGYNAYKNSLISKNEKYGDFIRKNYIYPVIYAESEYKIGDDTKSLIGLNDEKYMSDKSKNDDGTLSGKVIDTMYPYYEQLITELGGWDNSDEFFTKYFEKLCIVREEIFGDKYMTDEIMFTALESNVLTYGESLTGTEDEYDKNTGIQTSFKAIGKYQNKFGEDYAFSYSVKSTDEIKIENYKSSVDKAMLESYGVSVDDINSALTCTVEISANENAVAEQALTLVKIGSSWYVDNTDINTSALYKIG